MLQIAMTTMLQHGPHNDGMHMCRVYRQLCRACHLHESSPSKLFITHKAWTRARSAVKRGVPEQFFSKASGSNHMCAARVLKNDTYKPADFFFAAAICLFNRGLLGGIMERRYKKSLSIIQDWHVDAVKLAAHVGLCKKGDASKSHMGQMSRLLQACNGNAVMVQDVEGIQSQTLAKVPCIIENPTGEVAWRASYLASPTLAILLTNTVSANRVLYSVCTQYIKF